MRVGNFKYTHSGNVEENRIFVSRTSLGKALHLPVTKDFHKPRPAASISQVRPPNIFHDNFCLRTFFHSGYNLILTFNSLTILLGYCTGMEDIDYLA
jgi:hypothetical protein